MGFRGHETPGWLTPTVAHVDDGGEEAGYRRWTLRTGRGPVEARLYGPPDARAAVIAVGGVGGGFDTPARELYPRLGRALAGDGLATLRVRFRDPTDLEEAAHDVLAGVQALVAAGIEHVGLVGHSFGGAVAVIAGATSPAVVAVATLATQSYGTDAVGELAPRPLLLIHGTADPVLAPASSGSVYRRAREPRELVLFEGAGHVLDEVADEVFDRVHGWFLQHLGAFLPPGKAPPPARP
jgi:pimeloyl-ACP methyl ester carboxylesterase